ncbi:hypothetical protein B0H16DRAFT_1257600, partial [Mycena metata]
WDLQWLEGAVIVFDDQRTMTRLKGIAAREDRAMSKTELLELAMRYGMPFKLFSQISAVCDDAGNQSVESLAQKALYEPGYVDQPMTWVSTAGQKLVYLGGIHALLARPNAVAFLFLGGLPKFIAETFAPQLAFRLAQGPTAQTTQYNAGDSRVLPLTGRKGFWVAERVLGQELGLLIGAIPGTSAGAEKSLWPHPGLLEKASPHWR